MKSTLFVCSSHYGIDRDTNKFNIMGVIEDAQASGFPTLVPRIVASIFVEREPKDPRVNKGIIEVFLDRDRLISSEFVLDFQDSRRLRHTIDMQGIVIPRPGVLTFVAKAKAGKKLKTLASWKVNVTQIGQTTVIKKKK